MNRIITFILTICVLAGAMPATAQTDNEGYPVLYLRGAFNNWGYSDDVRFARNGNDYTLRVSRLDGDFKIGSAEWTTNWGTNSAVSGTCTLSCHSNGNNITAANLENVTISLSIDNPAEIPSDINISFSINGEEPPHGDNPYISGTLPVMYINVYIDESHSAYNNEVIDYNLDHKNYFEFAEYWLDLNGCEWIAAEGATSVGSADAPLPLQIKARGNWTRRGFSKKPFKLKLGAKEGLLGLTKSKHFALIAHADDSWGYLRNFTGFGLGKRMGLPWTPAQQPVEVVINGDYRGLYFLTESIRIEKNRINITELDDLCEDRALVSGGYLVELDNYDEDNQIRLTENSLVENHYLDALRITMDTPEEYSELQRRFVTDQFTAMNNAVGTGSNELWAYMDLDDAARYYLVEEIISHTESYHGSTYMFRDRGEGQKWHFSPLWDCGNAFSGPTDGFFYDHDPFGNTWIPSMRCNERFNAKVADTWKWFMSSRYPGIEDEISSYMEHIRQAAQADHRRWSGAPVPDGGQQVVDNRDIDGRRDAVLAHLRAKIQWLKGVFGDYEGTTYAEPERDTTPAAALPSYATGGVLSNVAVDTDAEPEYFNLQGIRVANPAPGRIYIERRGSAARTVRF